MSHCLQLTLGFRTNTAGSESWAGAGQSQPCTEPRLGSAGSFPSTLAGHACGMTNSLNPASWEPSNSKRAWTAKPSYPDPTLACSHCSQSSLEAILPHFKDSATVAIGEGSSSNHPHPKGQACCAHYHQSCTAQ